MAMHRELTVHYADGTAAVLQAVRDDARGREDLNRLAAVLLDQRNVVSVTVSAPTKRFVKATGKGSYR